jgi:hypothetical protein
MRYFLIVMLAGLTLSACDKSNDAVDYLPVEMGYDLHNRIYSGFEYNDTIYMEYGSCLFDDFRKNRVCFDSVLSDSRCPENVVCIWAGEAVARFVFDDYRNRPIQVDLRVGTTDTLIRGLKVSFVALLPYPNTEKPHEIEDYKAGLVITRQ